MSEAADEPLPPLETRFELGAQITALQMRFLDTHGFLIFSQVASRDEVATLASEIDRVASDWRREQRTQINGVPLFYGRDPEGAPFIQRLPFTSLFSDALRAFVRDERFAPIRAIIGDDCRVGDEEKDGLVVNRYVNVPGSAYPRLGWHTDGLRDLAYGRLPGPMLNVGFHLDEIHFEDGGLRLIPGTHKQGFLSMCFKKPYFIAHRPDPQELCVETQPGDLTIHDGRLWHRVARSQKVGWPSLRRSMYVPYLNGPYEPKSERSKTPIYHTIGRAMRAGRRLFSRSR